MIIGKVFGKILDFICTRLRSIENRIGLSVARPIRLRRVQIKSSILPKHCRITITIHGCDCCKTGIEVSKFYGCKNRTYSGSP